jgi:hypothetical protein
MPTHASHLTTHTLTYRSLRSAAVTHFLPTAPNLSTREGWTAWSTVPTPCVVHGVPADCPPEEVAVANGCNWVKRMSPTDSYYQQQAVYITSVFIGHSTIVHHCCRHFKAQNKELFAETYEMLQVLGIWSLGNTSNLNQPSYTQQKTIKHTLR